VKWYNLQLVWVAVPVLLAAFFAWRDRFQGKGVFFSNLAALKTYRTSLAGRMRFLPLFLRMLSLVLLVLGILRPQALLGENEVKLKGVNIMLVVDLSGSMVADDLKPDRLTAEKKALMEFVKRVKYDSVGLVIFGAQAFTQSPLTLDYDILTSTINEMDLTTVDADGTAIGDGLITAVNRITQSNGASTNVIVLATDGVNNKGEDPLKACEIAAAKKVRVYTIGIGAKGGAPIYTTDQFGGKRQFIMNGKPMNWEEPDEKVLGQIASKTGGEYFRATDGQSLDAVYARIDKLIKDEKKRKDPQYRELFNWFLLAGLGCLLLELLLSSTWLRSLT
jgi:Ca-activated chloride channel family protein